MNIFRCCIIMVCLWSTTLNAQVELYLGDVKALDSADYQPLEIPVFASDIRQSMYPIEIRFVSFEMRSNQQAILYYDRIEGWKSTWKDRNYSAEMTTINSASDTMNLDSMFSILVEHNLFSLPKQQEIYPHIISYHPDDNTFTGEGFGVGCGSHFCIEFKVGNTYRNYHFSNPEVYAEHYPNHPFFKDYVVIKDVFSSFFAE